MIKKLFLASVSIMASASLAFAAGQTEVSNVTQEIELESKASITAESQSAGGGFGFKGFGATGDAEYGGGVEVNTIDAGKNSTIKNVQQKLKMASKAEVRGSSVKMNTIKTRD